MARLQKLKSLGNSSFMNSLHQAFYEGDMNIICAHINFFRAKINLPPLNQNQHDEAKSFYEQYVRQHPPDGILRTSNFIAAALEHFS